MYDYAPNLLTLSCEQSLACTYIVPSISGRVIACPIAELLLFRINVKDRNGRYISLRFYLKYF